MARLASRSRLSFSKLREVRDLPNLIEVQTDSFRGFLSEGVGEVLRDISPIEDFSGQFKLELTDPDFDPPKHSEDECRERDMTYSQPLFVTARFMNAQTGEIKEQSVFMGDFPVMTDRGTFIINGTERIVVSQLVRSPGVYFGVNQDKTSPEKEIVDAKVIPSRGAWLEFEIDKRDVVYVRIDRKRKQPVTVLLKALGFGESDDELLALFTDEQGQPFESMRNTLAKDNTETVDEAFIDIYRKLRPGEPPTPESARALLENLFFNPKRYDLAKVGRHKVSKKLAREYDRVDLKRFDLEVPSSDVDAGGDFILSRADILAAVSYLVKLHAREQGYHEDDIDHFGNRRVRTVGELIQNQLRVGLSRMERVVRERMTTHDPEAITPMALINIRPVVAAIKEFFGSSQLSQFMDQTNPLAGLTHKRRLSALGPGGLSRERAGFEVRDVHSSHYGRMCPIETPEGPNIGLISSLACYARINEYGFIESPYKKVQDGRVHDHYRIVKAGDTNFTLGQIVEKRDLQKENNRIAKENAQAGTKSRKQMLQAAEAEPYAFYLSAWDEERYTIAQANVMLDDEGNLVHDRVIARQSGDFVSIENEKVDFIDVSPKQLVSVAASLVPFLENDDANRALMGANMQRQSVPLLRTESPLVGTGMENVVARDSGAVVMCKRGGVVDLVDSNRIIVRVEAEDQETGETKEFGADIYQLIKFKRSNQNTCITQKPVVREGQRVRKGQVLADGPCTDAGELALGRNILV
ncbi:MAG TPA: hypothetical protein VFZ83_08200, partial [Acidimicrobiia bacterium]|nr:hypothetical protein [Acidimicrobiia bacterium]